MPQPCLHTLIQSWVSLTQVRDSAQLDEALLCLVSACAVHATGIAPTSQFVLRQRALTTQLSASSPLWQELEAHALPSTILPELRACLHHPQADHYAWTTDTTVWHCFSLKSAQSHRQSALLLTHPALDAGHISLLIACLSGFYYYANLIVENERDALTGLLNRKTFDLQISKLLLPAQVPAPTAVQHFFAIFDIDGFKRINDNFGHLIGDEVLLLLSRLMRNSFREEDLLFRFGGEEFVGIFSCNQATEIQAKLERFQRTLAAASFPQVGKVTLSIGYAQLAPHSLHTVTLEHADMALYYAKEHGRNRICHYEDLVQRGLLQESDIQGEMELF